MILPLEIFIIRVRCLYNPKEFLICLKFLDFNQRILIFVMEIEIIMINKVEKNCSFSNPTLMK